MGVKVRQHYVPQCYLKKWLNKNEKMLLCQKNDIFNNEYVGKESILYENNYYTLTIKDCYLLTDDDAKIIFSCLENCKIFYDGEPLDTYGKLVYNFDRYEEWEICRNGTLMSEKRKNGYRINIESKRILRLEDFLSECIENSWERFVDEIVAKMMNSKLSITREFHKYDILEFALILKWRFKTGYSSIKEILDLVIEDIFNPKSFDYQNEITTLRRDMFLQQINRYAQYKNDCGKECIISKEIEYTRNLQFVFLIAQKGSFITSDNPYFTYIDSGKYDKNYNGIYFPMTPEVLLFMCNNSDEKNKKYMIRDLNINEVDKINKII